MKTQQVAAPAESIRCGIYTRKSTEEGLEQEFNSLDAQRESAEAFIRSQQHEGWTCLPSRYDDGGFTGGNMDRPALRRLMADIEVGKIDCVVVYKVDRLSRSLLDFARLMGIFEKHHISFVSVTQQFNTTHSMGRLTLNILMSFAEFERQLISERTRDKIAATRRRGKWSGGHPILGYDVNPQGFKLVVNEDEAYRIRAIFNLYLENQGLLAVVQELERRGWLTKQWTTRKGHQRGGRLFNKTSLHHLLTNVAYAGKVKYKKEVHEGEHQGIVDPMVWQRVQSLLQRNGRTGGAAVRNKFGALLKGILRCAPCGCAMTPVHTTKNRTKRYKYYTCTQAQKRGWSTCPSKSIPAGQIEAFVIDQIRGIGKDPALVKATFAEANNQSTTRADELDREHRGLERELTRWHAEVGKLAQDNHAAAVSRLADLHERISNSERRLTEINQQIAFLEAETVCEEEVQQALSLFDPVWESLSPREQVRIIELLVERVNYDGAAGKVSITFHPSGIKALADELAYSRKEIA
jgi:site-specific DNA recombinase